MGDRDPKIKMLDIQMYFKDPRGGRWSDEPHPRRGSGVPLWTCVVRCWVLLCKVRGVDRLTSRDYPLLVL